jgi:hypothetical protein
MKMDVLLYATLQRSKFYWSIHIENPAKCNSVPKPEAASAVLGS